MVWAMIPPLLPRLPVAPCLFLLTGLAPAEIRGWTTADGGRTLRAEYVSSADGEVTFRRERDRREFTLSLAKLSGADRERVQQKEAELEEMRLRESDDEWLFEQKRE